MNRIKKEMERGKYELLISEDYHSIDLYIDDDLLLAYYDGISVKVCADGFKRSDIPAYVKAAMVKEYDTRGLDKMGGIV
ncbi:MAG TPA: hypothetical protein PKW18_13915 [Candidatus Sumerlaeota bacterium]|nr:MAG: hypothetical protein BWY90_00046 [Deltaproteobacteria bacterium ADurb.BinA014]HOE64662.1 hypothetical protein [Candidatus Sumerlaeota bacterium]HOR65941.1 hypothetical protein [Candidatus Sumerlaeota bacterium]HPL75651.1 hypothetical protein [Candidatus Sumerlaeota bacterium]HRR31974.1 hypothetical protein [Candidatus Sumerlaeia bacterium]